MNRGTKATVTTVVSRDGSSNGSEYATQKASSEALAPNSAATIIVLPIASNLLAPFKAERPSAL